MNWIRRHPLFFACLAACAIVVALEAALLCEGIVRARRAVRSLAQKHQEREALASLSPAPSETNRRTIEAELKAMEETRTKLRSQLAGFDGLGANAVESISTPLEAYLAVTQFVETTRALALEKQVTLKPEERFGMASYLNEGPEATLVPAVNRQRLVLQEILGMLLTAGPRELLVVRRQRPVAADAPTSSDTGAVADYFSPARQSESAGADLFRTQAFQVEFVGHTPVLRDFLNALAGSKLPLLVRSLEVEPVESAVPGDRPGASAAVPLVTPNYSKFSVMVDFVELLPTAAKSP